MDIKGKYLSDSGVQLVIDYLDIHKVNGYFSFYLNKKKESFLLNGLINHSGANSYALIGIINWHKYFESLDAYTVFQTKFDDYPGANTSIYFDWFMSYDFNGMKKDSSGTIEFKRFVPSSDKEVVSKNYSWEKDPIVLINSILENGVTELY